MHHRGVLVFLSFHLLCIRPTEASRIILHGRIQYCAGIILLLTMRNERRAWVLADAI